MLQSSTTTPSNNNPRVPLKSGGYLYIGTSQIIQPGYHWAIYHTSSGSDGSTKLHWVQPGPQGKAEGVRRNNLVETTVYSHGLNWNIAFFEVQGFDRTTPFSKIEEYGHTIFPEGGYSTVRENRQMRITCRTWILELLRLLKANGHLRCSESPSEFEALVISGTQQAEAEETLVGSKIYSIGTPM